MNTKIFIGCILVIIVILIIGAVIWIKSIQKKRKDKEGTKIDNSKKLTSQMKDAFTEDMFQLEFSDKIKGIPDATKLFFKKTAINNVRTKTTQINVEYGEDSLYEIYFYVSAGYKVAATNAANAKVLGGGFTTNNSERKGKGTQEESLMCLIRGLLKSLLAHATKSNTNAVMRNSQNGRIPYDGRPLDHNILLSKSLSPRIKMSVFKDYKNETEGFTWFNDYVVFKYSTNKGILASDIKDCFNIFSMAAFDRRGKGTNDVDYSKLKENTTKQISTMLRNTKNDSAVIITIPGSGVFANYSYNDSKKDVKYLEAVEDGTFEAIRKYGKDFKNCYLWLQEK